MNNTCKYISLYSIIIVCKIVHSMDHLRAPIASLCSTKAKLNSKRESLGAICRA